MALAGTASAQSGMPETFSRAPVAARVPRWATARRSVVSFAVTTPSAAPLYAGALDGQNTRTYRGTDGGITWKATS